MKWPSLLWNCIYMTMQQAEMLNPILCEIVKGLNNVFTTQATDTHLSSPTLKSTASQQHCDQQTSEAGEILQVQEMKIITLS